jgi:hypothetical protein
VAVELNRSFGVDVDLAGRRELARGRCFLEKGDIPPFAGVVEMPGRGSALFVSGVQGKRQSNRVDPDLPVVALLERPLI